MTHVSINVCMSRLGVISPTMFRVGPVAPARVEMISPTILRLGSIVPPAVARVAEAVRREGRQADRVNKVVEEASRVVDSSRNGPKRKLGATHDEDKTDTAIINTSSNAVVICASCGREGHKRCNHHSCPMNPAR